MFDDQSLNLNLVEGFNKNTKFRVNWPFGSGEEVKIDFQDAGNLGFPIERILATFDQQVVHILPTKFQFELILIYKLPGYFLPSFKSTGLSVQEKKGKWRPSWISYWNHFSSS